MWQSDVLFLSLAPGSLSRVMERYSGQRDALMHAPVRVQIKVATEQINEADQERTRLPGRDGPSFRSTRCCGRVTERLSIP
jgi:hypothetical protein